MTIEKSIRNLLAKQPLTGDDAGRIMILDLLSAYKNLVDGGNGDGVLTDEEKINIVNGLTNTADVQRFNEFRYVHDFLTTAGAVYESFAKTFEVYYWTLYHLLTDMKYAEIESRHTKRSPVVMTKTQYEHFQLSGDPAPFGGIAVLQDFPAYNGGRIDENGFYREPEPEWRHYYVAERILSGKTDSIKEGLNGIKDMLAECYARQKGLELIGRFIKITDVKVLIRPVDERAIALLNDTMSDIIKNISSCGDRTEEQTEDIRQKLSELLKPIDTAALTPEPQAVTKAKRALNFAFIKNNSEAFAAMLKREWRNDC